MKRTLLALASGLSLAVTLAVGSASADGPPPVAPVAPAAPASSSSPPAVAPEAGAPATATHTQASAPDAGALPVPVSTPRAKTPSLDTAEVPMVRARRRPKPRYGAAGCGLGSVIFGTKPGLAQVTAASTNTLGMQTFALTSGTINCDSIDDHETIENFVRLNREAFMKDAARGSGETIATLTAIAGCADPVTVGRALKAQYGPIFATSGGHAERIARSVRALLRADAQLACENLTE